MKNWKIAIAYPQTGEKLELTVEGKDENEARTKFFRRKQFADIIAQRPGQTFEFSIEENIDNPGIEHYTREVLIELCEDGMTEMSKWHNRDSFSAHHQLGVAFALLKCRVPFRIEKADPETVWIDFYDIEGFQHFESAEHDGNQYYETDTAYIPTRHRLEKAGGKDWY